MPLITKKNADITVGNMKYKDENVSQKKINMSQHRGEQVRTHISNEGEYIIETRPEQKLLICEIAIPEKKWIVTNEIATEIPLDLSKISIIEYIKNEKEEVIIK